MPGAANPCPGKALFLAAVLVQGVPANALATGVDPFTARSSAAGSYTAGSFMAESSTAGSSTVRSSTVGSSKAGSSTAGSATAQAYHAHLADLLTHAARAASFFIPAHLTDALPTPRTTAELAERWGYPFESRQMETDDGHVLLQHRFPRPGAPAVLMAHGLLCTSTEWLHAGPNYSLAFRLYDAGYDVWMVNFRGNLYSLGHRNLTIAQSAFWNYSFHEHGVQDLRTALTEVHAVAREPVTVIAHSMGCAALLALLSELPDYSAMVRHAVLLGPVASMRGVTQHPLRVLAQYGRILGRALRLFGVDPVLAVGVSGSRLLALLCHAAAPTAHLCRQAVAALMGHSVELLDAELLPRLFIQQATGTTARTLVHLSECLVAGTFLKPRHDEDAAIEEYNLTAVSAPLTLVYSDNDLLSAAEEAMWIHDKTKDVSTVHMVPLAGFNHIDFLYSSNASYYEYIITEVVSRRPAGFGTASTTAPTEQQQQQDAEATAIGTIEETTIEAFSNEEGGGRHEDPEQAYIGHDLDPQSHEAGRRAAAVSGGQGRHEGRPSRRPEH